MRVLHISTGTLYGGIETLLSYAGALPRALPHMDAENLPSALMGGFLQSWRRLARRFTSSAQCDCAIHFPWLKLGSVGKRL